MKLFPRYGDSFFDSFMKDLQDKSFKIRPEWGFEVRVHRGSTRNLDQLYVYFPQPPQKIPMVSDNLVPFLEDGSIESVKGIKRILGPTTVELDDGKKIDVDTLIWCTGYQSDFSMIDPRFDPSCCPSKWLAASGSNNKALFRLYHNVFSLEKPDSLAFLGYIQFALGGFQIFDMASQAIAQVWQGASSLPTHSEMESSVQKQHDWLIGQAQHGNNISSGTTDADPWMRAIEGLAGTGVYEYLGYGWKGWLFWLRDRSFCNMLMGGIWSPHIHRVFEGRRKTWAGARQAIERVNEAVAARRRMHKQE